MDISCLDLDKIHRVCVFRGAPAGFSALLCQAAQCQLLQDDLSPFHCPQEAEDDQDEEQPVACECYLGSCRLWRC